MGTNVIEIEGLRKEYRRRKGTTVAVDGLDLAVPAGGVYGFLGPNGSGKTTTIRCVLGLARPTKGSVRLLGRPVPEGLAESLRGVGAIVESPALFPTMSRPRQPRAARRDRSHRPQAGRARRSSRSGWPSGPTTSCTSTRSACANDSRSPPHC